MTTRVPSTTPQRRNWEPGLGDYRDDGCAVSPSCLTCPLMLCIYDDPRAFQRQAHAARDREIARLSAAGKSARQLANQFHLTRRHIFRILRQERGARN